MTTKIMSFLLLISMGFTACKKESTTEPKTKTTREKLVGKWNLVSELTNDYYSGTSHLHTYPFPAGDYAEFTSDGKYIEFRSGSSSTYDYGIVNDSHVWLLYSGNVYTLKLLTETALQLYKKEVFSPTEYYESTLSLTK